MIDKYETVIGKEAKETMEDIRFIIRNLGMGIISKEEAIGRVESKSASYEKYKEEIETMRRGK